MLASAALREAVEELYESFARYPLPTSTDPCPCCHSQDDEITIGRGPLRERSPAQLWRYTQDALLTWGGVEVLKHFLPRILEITATSDLVTEFVDPEVVFAKLRYGDWFTWAKNEQAAVRNFLQAMWTGILSDPPPEEGLPDMETWLCSIAQCEEDLSPYLDQWMEDESLSAALALSYLLRHSALTHTENTERSPYWRERDAQYRQLRVWATSSAVIWKLRHAEIRWRYSGHFQQFAKARQLISESANQRAK